MLPLKLTKEEERWNSYRGENGLPMVLDQSYPYSASITSARQTASVPHFTARRARVKAITWTGDVNGLKVNISTSTGEKLTVAPCHIPLLSGHSPFSTYTRSPLVAGYPSTILGAAAPTRAFAPSWIFELDPNLVLASNVTLSFDYSLEDISPTGDLTLNAGGTYTVSWMVHQWEFPGFQGGAA